MNKIIVYEKWCIENWYEWMEYLINNIIKYERLYFIFYIREGIFKYVLK